MGRPVSAPVEVLAIFCSAPWEVALCTFSALLSILSLSLCVCVCVCVCVVCGVCLRVCVSVCTDPLA